MIFFPEPASRERKPSFADVPPRILDEVSRVAGSRVAGGETAYGGFSTAANFIFALDDGRRIFAKGNHPLEESHGVQNLRQEIGVYQNAAALKDIAPPFLGAVFDGDEDGWALGLWDYIEHAPSPPSAAAVLGALERWGAGDGAFLPGCREKSYIRDFFSGERNWLRLGAEEKVRARFLSLFDDGGTAARWLEKNLSALCAAQEKIKGVSGAAPVHGDLRADNAFQDARGKVYIVDWPNACLGPPVFDRVLFGASLEAAGRGPIEDVLGAGRPDDAVAMAAVFSGHFADHAGRAVPAALPRLRWMQRSLLVALLRFLGRAGVVESVPGMSNQQA